MTYDCLKIHINENSVASKLGLILLITVIIAVGIGWAITHSSDRNEILLVEKAIDSFFVKSKQLEPSLIKSEPLSKLKETLNLSFENQTTIPSQTIEIEAIGEIVVLRFLESDSDLSGKSINFEPVIVEQKVLWKCLNGSVLLRYRPKRCQLGEAVNAENFKAMF